MHPHHKPDHDHHGHQSGGWGWATAYPDYPTYIVEGQPETPTWVWVALGGALLLLLMRNN